ncbi:MAG TPA: hypothetical protein VM366_05795 [Anaerolineae bacterium]|nr:hypothetical protein [Anaerolineae bacterium]
MLRGILQRLTPGGTWTIARLADELDTTPQLVEAALDELARRGYIRPVGQADAGACTTGVCTACPVSGGCVRRTGARVWSTTGTSHSPRFE